MTLRLYRHPASRRLRAKPQLPQPEPLAMAKPRDETGAQAHRTRRPPCRSNAACAPHRQTRFRARVDRRPRWWHHVRRVLYFKSQIRRRIPPAAGRSRWRTGARRRRNSQTNSENDWITARKRRRSKGEDGTTVTLGWAAALCCAARREPVQLSVLTGCPGRNHTWNAAGRSIRRVAIFKSACVRPREAGWR